MTTKCKLADNRIGRLTAGLNITWRCNLKCRHCQPFLPDKKDLPRETIQRNLRAMKKGGYLVVNITGGEPLMRKDFCAIMNYASSLGLAVLLSTNATLVTKKLIAGLKKARVLRVYVSVFGSTARIHEKITGVKGSFRKSMRAISLLKARGQRPVVKITAMEENRRDIGKLKLLAKNMGLEYTVSELRY